MNYTNMIAGCTSVGDFATRLVASVSSDEWLKLEEGGFKGEVSAFNRETLLRLRRLGYRGQAEGPFDADRASRMADMLQSFLDEHLPGNQSAQRWIMLSCFALAFVFCEPLHPVEVVKAKTRTVDGETTYYCPAREGDETLCGFCVCRPIIGLALVRENLG